MLMSCMQNMGPIKGGDVTKLPFASQYLINVSGTVLHSRAYCTACSRLTQLCRLSCLHCAALVMCTALSRAGVATVHGGMVSRCQAAAHGTSSMINACRHMHVIAYTHARAQTLHLKPVPCTLMAIPTCMHRAICTGRGLTLIVRSRNALSTLHLTTAKYLLAPNSNRHQPSMPPHSPCTCCTRRPAT